MKTRVKLVDLKIPEQSAEFIIDRVHPFLEKYTVDLKVSSTLRGRSFFGMKELLCSVYSQGLSDANEALTPINEN